MTSYCTRRDCAWTAPWVLHSVARGEGEVIRGFGAVTGDKERVAWRSVRRSIAKQIPILTSLYCDSIASQTSPRRMSNRPPSVLCTCKVGTNARTVAQWCFITAPPTLSAPAARPANHAARWKLPKVKSPTSCISRLGPAVCFFSLAMQQTTISYDH